jgi:ubiquinone/menaquinone biosynthesis C-methylase UbiE
MENDAVKEKSKKHFDTSATEYDASFDGRFVKVMYPALLQEIEKETEGKLLDVGCGNGNVLCRLVNNKRELYGVDLSENMVEECKKRMGARAEIAAGDAQRLPFEDHMFNTVVCNASFHHYPHPEEVLTEMRRVLKYGGRLLIGEGYAIQPFRVLLNLSFRWSDSGDYHSYGKRELIKLLQKHGFQVERVIRTSHHTMLYVART